jgi:hypothetical protein
MYFDMSTMIPPFAITSGLNECPVPNARIFAPSRLRTSAWTSARVEGCGMSAVEDRFPAQLRQPVPSGPLSLGALMLMVPADYFC